METLLQKGVRTYPLDFVNENLKTLFDDGGETTIRQIYQHTLFLFEYLKVGDEFV